MRFYNNKVFYLLKCFSRKILSHNVIMLFLISLCILLFSCSTTRTAVRHTQNTTPAVSTVNEPAPAPKVPIEVLAQLDPSHPSGLGWSEELLVKVDEGIGLSSTDSISALLKFKSVLEQEKNGPNTKQREWLQSQIDELQPKALKQAQIDFGNAAKAIDLSDVLLIRIVGKKIDEGFTTSTSAQFSLVKGDILSGKFKGPFVWKVSKLEAERIAGKFTEDGSVFDDKVTLTPNSGFELIRVKAYVENISSDGTKPYTYRAFGGIRQSCTKPKSGVYRWLSDEMFSLVTPGGDFITPSYALAGWGMSVSFNSQTKIFIPEAKVSGEGTNVDFIFSVPKGMSELRFLMYGAEPHNLSL